MPQNPVDFSTADYAQPPRADEPHVPRGDDSSEMRSSPRLPYRYCQIAASVTGNRTPRSDEFFEIECLDLSAGGFSFLMKTRPQFEHCVVGLGRESSRHYYRARVVHVDPIKLNGIPFFRIGCRFTEAVYL